MIKNINYLHSCFSVNFTKPQFNLQSQRLADKHNFSHLAFFCSKRLLQHRIADPGDHSGNRKRHICLIVMYNAEWIVKLLLEGKRLRRKKEKTMTFVHFLTTQQVTNKFHFPCQKQHDTRKTMKTAEKISLKGFDFRL